MNNNYSNKAESISFTLNNLWEDSLQYLYNEFSKRNCTNARDTYSDEDIRSRISNDVNINNCWHMVSSCDEFVHSDFHDVHNCSTHFHQSDRPSTKTAEKVRKYSPPHQKKLSDIDRQRLIENEAKANDIQNRIAQRLGLSTCSDKESDYEDEYKCDNEYDLFLFDSKPKLDLFDCEHHLPSEELSYVEPSVLDNSQLDSTPKNLEVIPSVLDNLHLDFLDVKTSQIIKEPAQEGIQYSITSNNNNRIRNNCTSAISTNSTIRLSKDVNFNFKDNTIIHHFINLWLYKLNHTLWIILIRTSIENLLFAVLAHDQINHYRFIQVD